MHQILLWLYHSISSTYVNISYHQLYIYNYSFYFIYAQTIIQEGTGLIREILQLILAKTHTKKVLFLEVGPLRFYPPYPNGLVVQATFFSFIFIIAWNGFWPFFFTNFFWLKESDFFSENIFSNFLTYKKPPFSHSNNIFITHSFLVNFLHL